MNANYKPDEPGAVLLIAKNGQPIFRKAYGLANIEFNISNKPDYIFRIASMSKQFTAVCVLKLAQEGKLNLDDDIRKFLPYYNTHGRHITIENVLSHTSGIVDFTEKKEFAANAILEQSHQDLLNSFMNDSLLFEPGTDWSYSGSGYVLAGLIIEKISGMPLSEYLKQNIFDPLDMSHTSLGNYDSTVINQVYGYDGAGNDKFKPATYMSWTWPYAEGDIISNADDLLKWDNALYTEKIIKKEWLEKAWEPFVLSNGQTTNYGLGWTINQFKGVRYIEHAGGINGFSSDGIRIPSKHLYLLLLSNRNPPWPPAILSGIALYVAGQTLTKPSARHIDQKTLEVYTGVYRIHRANARIPDDSARRQIYQYVTTNGDTLFAQVQYYWKTPLVNVSNDLFADGNHYYLFHPDEKNKVVSVELYDEPVQLGPHEVELKTDLPLPKEKHPITLNIHQLELLPGRYDEGNGIILSVTVDGDNVYLQLPQQDKFRILAEDETHFYFDQIDGTVEFIKEKNKITGIIVNLGGPHKCMKIE
jgi:CubicO group peptidase (beta-lactamase class C family)